jgi:hypothetical protein
MRSVRDLIFWPLRWDVSLTVAVQLCLVTDLAVANQLPGGDENCYSRPYLSPHILRANFLPVSFTLVVIRIASHQQGCGKVTGLNDVKDYTNLKYWKWSDDDSDSQNTILLVGNNELRFSWTAVRRIVISVRLRERADEVTAQVAEDRNDYLLLGGLAYKLPFKSTLALLCLSHGAMNITDVIAFKLLTS